VYICSLQNIDISFVASFLGWDFSASLIICDLHYPQNRILREMAIVILLISEWCIIQLCSLILFSSLFPLLQNSLYSRAFLQIAILFAFKINVVFLLLELVQFMNAFDRAMNLLDDKFSFLASTKQIVSSTNNEDKVNMPPNDCTMLIRSFLMWHFLLLDNSEIFRFSYTKTDLNRLHPRIYTLVYEEGFS